jgi:predicted AAA+ superfamily ATPase
MNKFVHGLESKTQELMAEIPTTIRPWSLNHDLGQDRRALIAGPRGVSKTTFLLSQAKKHQQTLYFSADHPKANSVSLYSLGEENFRQKL